jgi:outer membrane protein
MKSILLISILVIGVKLKAQITIDSLLDRTNNNLSVLQKLDDVKIAYEKVKEAKSLIFPSLSFTQSNGFTFGRFIDPFSNEFRQVNNYYNTFSLNLNWIIYTGGQYFRQLEYEKSVVSLRKDELSLISFDLKSDMVISYFALRNLMDEKKTIIKQLKVNDKEVGIGEKLYDSGEISSLELLEIKNIERLNNIKSKGIDSEIAQYIEYIRYLCGEKNLILDDLKVPLVMDSLDFDSTAFNFRFHPLIAVVSSRLNSIKANNNIMKTLYSPSVSINANFYTGYSAANRLIDLNTGSEIKYPFQDQLLNNQNQVININLSIPIYNRRTTLTKVEIAKIEAQQQEKELFRVLLDMEHVYTKNLQELRSLYNNYNDYKQFIKSQDLIFKSKLDLLENGDITLNEYLVHRKEFFETQNELNRIRNEYLTKKYLFKQKFSAI